MGFSSSCYHPHGCQWYPAGSWAPSHVCLLQGLSDVDPMQLGHTLYVCSPRPSPLSTSARNESRSSCQTCNGRSCGGQAAVGGGSNEHPLQASYGVFRGACRAAPCVRDHRWGCPGIQTSAGTVRCWVVVRIAPAFERICVHATRWPRSREFASGSKKTLFFWWHLIFCGEQQPNSCTHTKKIGRSLHSLSCVKPILT